MKRALTRNHRGACHGVADGVWRAERRCHRDDVRHCEARERDRRAGVGSCRLGHGVPCCLFLELGAFE